jgi:hypothetical protein
MTARRESCEYHIHCVVTVTTANGVAFFTLPWDASLQIKVRACGGPFLEEHRSISMFISNINLYLILKSQICYHYWHEIPLPIKNRHGDMNSSAGKKPIGRYVIPTGKWEFISLSV